MRGDVHYLRDIQTRIIDDLSKKKNNMMANMFSRYPPL